MHIVIHSSFLPRTGNEGPEREQRHSSTLSLTSALYRSGWLTTRPGRFTPQKDTRYPLCRRLGGPQSPCAEDLALTGIRSPECPARGESLYRLSYPGPTSVCVLYFILSPFEPDVPEVVHTAQKVVDLHAQAKNGANEIFAQRPIMCGIRFS